MQNKICPFCEFVKNRKKSDWPIVKLVGSLTYGQILDHFPGLYEPFNEIRNIGDSMSSIMLNPFIANCQNTHSHRLGLNVNHKNRINNTTLDIYDLKAPYPPNLVSSVFLDSEVKECEFKYMLCNAADKKFVDKRIEPLINSSQSYNSHEFSLYETVEVTVIYTLLILGVFIIYNKI